MRTHWDTIVVGAGPGGASAAYHLARAGMDVLLLDRRSFPRDKVCGDGLTRSAVKLLKEMRVLDELQGAQPIRGVRVHMRGEQSRDFPFPLERHPGTEGLVVPRLALDDAICRRAVSAGATLREDANVQAPIIEKGVVVGVTVSNTEGHSTELRARVVIAADGAASRLAKAVGLRQQSTAGVGVAVRAYYADIDGLDDRLEFHLSLTDVSDRIVLPSYGWVFPTGAHTANVGVGLFGRVPGHNVRQLMQTFLERDLGGDARFSRIRSLSPVEGAPLRFDFDPSRCAVPGMLLVGDAAGLVSPFTGEGISYSLESGQVAADSIQRWFQHHPATAPDGQDYSLRLAQQYAGYFEAGRYSGDRHRLIWNVLKNTFASERPLHRLCRRLILVPDGTHAARPGELLEDVRSLLPRSGVSVRPRMIEIANLMTDTVRRDWPFLARLSTGRVDPSSTPLRPSLLMLVCGYFGDPDTPCLVEAGVAAELGSLAFLAHTGISDGTTGWGNTFSVLVGEFLLAKAYELAGEVGPEATLRVSQAVSTAIRGRVRQRRIATSHPLSDRELLELLEATVGALGKLPCGLGAWAAGAPDPVIRSLERYGVALAVAHTLVDEITVLQGSDDPVVEVASADLDDGIYGLPIARALRSQTNAARRLRDLLERRPLDRAAIGRAVRASGVLESVRADSARYVRRAKRALRGLPAIPARAALEHLADYTLSRQLPDVPVPQQMLAAMGPL